MELFGFTSCPYVSTVQPSSCILLHILFITGPTVIIIFAINKVDIWSDESFNLKGILRIGEFSLHELSCKCEI